MTVSTPVIDYIDGSARRIYLKQGVSDYYPIEDVYHEYRTRRREDTDGLRKWEPLLKADGNVAKGGGAFTPRYVVLLDETKIIPYDESLQLNQLGDIITDTPDTSPNIYDVSGLTVAKPIFIKPSEAETIQLNSESIVYSSFQGAVTIDVTSPWSDVGTPLEPNGNVERPINNVVTAVQIANDRGFTQLNIIGNVDVVDGDDISGFILKGQSPIKTTIDVKSEAISNGVEFLNAHIVGELDGNSIARECMIDNVSYIDGFIDHCMINAGVVVLSGGITSHIMDSYSGVAGTGTPTIDFGGAGQSLALRNWNGGIKLTNKSGNESVSIDLSSGQIKIDPDPISGITNGTIVCRGVGKVVNSETGESFPVGVSTLNNAIIINETVNIKSIPETVWGARVSEFNDKGSFGHDTKITNKIVGWLRDLL